MAPSRLCVSVSDGDGRSVSVPGLVSWLVAIAPSGARGAMTVVLVADGRMRALNRRYRGVDGVTDVLSFASGPEGRHDAAPPFLGDVVIATGVARRQARAAGHSLGAEYRLLALHGLLHLMGYDHERDEGRMARLERRLRRRGGLERGLIERSGAGRSARTAGRGPTGQPRGGRGPTGRS